MVTGCPGHQVPLENWIKNECIGIILMAFTEVSDIYPISIWFDVLHKATGT